MTAVALARMRCAPAALGLFSFVVLIGLVELLIRIGLINRFIVPMPSDIIAAFPRVVIEEHVLQRFLLTASEAFSASILVTIFGVAGGVLLHRYRLLRLATETWVAAIAAAPLVLMYPLYLVIFGRSALTIVMMGFSAGLAPIILKTLEGLSGTRRVLINVGKSFNLTASQQFWKILFPAALPTIFVGLRLGVIFSLINIVGVEFRSDQRGEELQSHGVPAILEDTLSRRAADHLRGAAARVDLLAHQHRRGRVPDQFRRPRAAHPRACRALRSGGDLCRD